MLQMLKVEKVKQRNQGLKSHSASVLELKNELKILTLFLCTGYTVTTCLEKKATTSKYLVN